MIRTFVAGASGALVAVAALVAMLLALARLSEWLTHREERREAVREASDIVLP